MKQLNRNAITIKGIVRRIRDAQFEAAPDLRSTRGRRLSHTALVGALMLGMLNACLSLRAVESLTAALSPDMRSALGIPGRISDTKLRDTLLSLRWTDAREALVRYVKAEHARGTLAPERLPFGVLAIDGKSLGRLGSWAHEFIQKVVSRTAGTYGLARVHRATLVSSSAPVVIDQRPIEGATNEIGALPLFLKGLFQTYARTRLFEVIVADAGNSSKAVMQQLHSPRPGQ